MRSSPINHLRNNRDLGQSPYRSIVQNRSTQRQNNYSPQRTPGDAEYWRQRARSLEAEVLALNEQMVFQARKIDKIDDLQSKIEVLLNQNSHLIDQNQNLIKLIQQKKAQTQLWKSKFEGEYSHSNVAQAQKKKIFEHLNIKDQQNQYQVQKLMAEISRLHDQLEQMENLKQIELNMLKNKYENETINQIQSLKRSQYSNNEVHELNIRKLKDVVKQKQFQIQNFKRQAKLQNERLNGQINFLKSEIKKIEHQRQHELDLLKTQHENSKNNLLRAHRKNEEQMKSLQEAKVKRLMHEIEEKKNQIEDCYGKIKKGGKENQAELTNMVNEKSKLRIQMRQNDNVNREKINEITNFYENQLSQLRDNNQKRQTNLIDLYDSEIASLKEVIEAKEEQIQRLLQLNADIRRNQQIRLNDIKKNNQELKAKIQDLVMHYERQVQLMKIKVAQLYEADLQALRNNTQNRLALNYREKQNLRQLLQQTQDKYAKAVQDNLDLRIQYENRLNQFKIKYEREHQQLLDMIAMHEKQVENLTSRASATHISHNDLYQKQNLNRKELMNEKRNLQKQIINKNKQIQALNLRIQTMQGYSKRQITKLQEQILKLKNEHQAWIAKQDKQTEQWKNQRAQLKEKNHQLDRKLQDTNLKKKQSQEALKRKIEELRFKVAQHEGTIQQLREKCQILDSKNKVQIGNLDKARLQSQALMNTQKDKLSQVRSREKQLFTDENMKIINELRKQIQGLKHENDILRDHNEKSKIRQAELNTQISNLLNSVNKRNVLQQHVINIGLSNNYFKNVAEIFKKTISP